MVARSFESAADANIDNVYEVTVKATDEDGNTATKAITLTIINVQEQTTLAITGLAVVSVPENEPWTSSVPTLTGTPVGEVTWTKEGDDASDFSINSSTGVLSMVSRDYESPEDANTDNAYEVTVKATDADDNSAMVSIMVTVTDVQESVNLAITGLDDDVVENTVWTSLVPVLTGTPIGDVTWTKEGTDTDDFTINSTTGRLSMVARDFESPVDDDTDNIYEVTVRVTDADDNTTTKAITVTVTDVRESATLTITGLSNATVAENTPWTSAQPTLTGTPIGDVTWTKEGTDDDDFTIDPSTGVLSMAARDFESPEDADQDNAYEVTVTVEDDDGNTATQALMVTVTVTDVRETGDAYHHGVVERDGRREYAVDLGATNVDRHAHRRRDLDEGRHRRRRLHHRPVNRGAVDGGAGF